MSEKVFIIGVGMLKFGKYLDRNVKSLAGEALDLARKDCNIELNDIESAWFSNSLWGLFSGQHCIRGQVALSANGLDKIPIINVENGCAGGSTALHSAVTAVKAGMYDCTLAIGAEKVYNKDRDKVMKSFASGADVEIIEMFVKALNDKKNKKENDAETKQQDEKKAGHSTFMDLYAAGARMHMEKYGTTQHQLAVVAAKSHNNSVLNPLAQYTFPMTIDGVMNDRAVSFPLTRAMCAPIGDGAAAVIVCSEKFLKKNNTKRSIRIRASVMQSGQLNGESDISKRSSRAAYEQAGIGPEDINVAEIHDATVFGEIYQSEQLGFCPEGEGGIFAEEGHSSLKGRLPINPSGGLISRGHPIGASGLAQIYELVTQLRGEAGGRQVENPRIALAENGGGFLGMGEASMAVHLLEN
ncbi:MAG: thiolase family protein [Thermodesulfobacteriota bacterium]